MKREKQVTLLFNQHEYNDIAQAANANGQQVAVFIRSSAIKAAREVRRDIL